jgi:hypothetical protein
MYCIIRYVIVFVKLKHYYVAVASMVGCFLSSVRQNPSVCPSGLSRHLKNGSTDRDKFYILLDTICRYGLNLKIGPLFPRNSVHFSM